MERLLENCRAENPCHTALTLLLRRIIPPLTFDVAEKVNDVIQSMQWLAVYRFSSRDRSYGAPSAFQLLHVCSLLSAVLSATIPSSQINQGTKNYRLRSNHWFPLSTCTESWIHFSILATSLYITSRPLRFCNKALSKLSEMTWFLTEPDMSSR